MKITLLITSVLLSGYIYSQEKIIIQPGPDNGKDAWVWSGTRTSNANFGIKQDYNQGLHNVLRAEVWKWFGQTESDTIRSFIEFDLSKIPQNAIILEAKLSFYHYSNPGFTPHLGENAFVISQVLEPWKEDSVNWNNQPRVSDEMFTATESSQSNVQNYIDLDIRSLVQESVYFPDQNYGYRISLVKEAPYNGVTFASSDHENFKLRPKVEVIYIVP